MPKIYCGVCKEITGHTDDRVCLWCGESEYNSFIRSGLAAGFTDDQINFLEEWILKKL